MLLIIQIFLLDEKKGFSLDNTFIIEILHAV